MQRHRSRRASIARTVACGTAVAVLLAGCGGEDEPKSSTGGAAAAASSSQASYPTASDEQIAKTAARAMNPDIEVASLAPEVKTMLASASNPLTAKQQAIWEKCVAEPICETGQGDKTVALIDDIKQPWYSIAAGEFIAQAIQSGQVKKLIHSSSNVDVQQYLAAFRQAISQRVDLIVSEFGALGGQAGPVLAQAKAAGVPVVNAAVVLPNDLGKNLAVELRASPCDMWKTGAQQLTDHLKSKGITNPTYAMFSGPAGNAYATSWQPCGEKALKALGWSKVYTGYDIWTPQGQAQAASALLASGKKPDVILADIAPTQFLDAYEKAREKLPVVMVAGSVDVNALKGYVEAQRAGTDPDIWTTSNVGVMLRLALVTGLKVANGEKPSSNPVSYPVGAIPFSDVVKLVDLDVDSNAIAGNLLTPAQQNEALKH